MRRLIIPAVFVLAATLTTGCAITNKYGPYMGRVVDRETKEPLPGTVVFVRFYAVGIFQLSQFADAVETVTDNRGEFHIPAKRIFTTPVPFGRWEPPASIIFKPGYGVYPSHPKSIRKPDSSDLIRDALPKNQFAVIELPRLKTRKEREKAVIDDLWLGSGVPKGKFKLIENAIKQELNFLALCHLCRMS